MIRRTISASMFIGLGMMFVWTGAAVAEGALAVGLPNDDPQKGFVYGITVDKPSAEEAQRSAMSECKGVDVRDTSRAKQACKIIETFRNQCANAAFNGDRNTVSTAVGWGIGPDSATANNRALVMCNTVRKGTGRPCVVDGDPVCDGDAK